MYKLLDSQARSMQSWFRVIVCSLTLLGVVGCGDGIKRVPIQGLLTCEGVPVDFATVQFIPGPGVEGEGAIGQTSAAGRFTLVSSRQSDEGIPPGNYTVRVTRLVDFDGTVLPANAAEADYPRSRESIPPPYSGMSSPLEAVISEEGGELKLDIPKKLLVKKKL